MAEQEDQRGTGVGAEILGGAWDIAVRTRATWLWNERGWDPDDGPYHDLSEYETRLNTEAWERFKERRKLLLMAGFSNVAQEVRWGHE